MGDYILIFCPKHTVYSAYITKLFAQCHSLFTIDIINTTHCLQFWYWGSSKFCHLIKLQSLRLPISPREPVIENPRLKSIYFDKILNFCFSFSNIIKVYSLIKTIISLIDHTSHIGGTYKNLNQFFF